MGLLRPDLIGLFGTNQGDFVALLVVVNEVAWRSDGGVTKAIDKGVVGDDWVDNPMSSCLLYTSDAADE